MKSKRSQKDEYQTRTIELKKSVLYYQGTYLPRSINYNVKSEKTDNQVNANLTYENTYIGGNITKVVEKESRFINNPESDDLLQINILSLKTTQYGYDSYDRLTVEIKPNGDCFDYVYGEISNMIEYIKKMEKNIELLNMLLAS